MDNIWSMLGDGSSCGPNGLHLTNAWSCFCAIWPDLD